MTIEGFDYKAFVQELSSQTDDFLPAYFYDFQKEYVKDTLLKISLYFGEAIYNYEKSNFSVIQAKIITQIIAEWVFHKSIDLIKSGIPYDYWDGILDSIALSIFKLATQEISRVMPSNNLLQIVEQVVNETYRSSLIELGARNIIDKSILDRALNQSNIDDFM